MRDWKHKYHSRILQQLTIKKKRTEHKESPGGRVNSSTDCMLTCPHKNKISAKDFSKQYM